MIWQNTLSRGISEWNPHAVDYGSQVLRRSWPVAAAAETTLEGTETTRFPSTITSFISGLKHHSLNVNGTQECIFQRDACEILFPNPCAEPMRKKRLDFQGVLVKARRPFEQPKRNHKMRNWKNLMIMPLQAQVTSATLKSLQETREWLIKGNDVYAPNTIWVFDREVPHIGLESDVSDITRWEFEEKHILAREENLLEDTFAILRGQIANSWADSNPTRPVVPALFEDLDCSNSEDLALTIGACSDINCTWSFDHKTMPRDTEEGCAFFEQELRRVCQGSLSIQDWVVEIDAYSLDDCFHQNVSLPLPEPWLHPRQLERQLEALNGYKAPLLIDSLDVHLKWDLAGACRRGLREETSKTKSWRHVVMRQDWPIGSAPLKDSPDQVNQYFQCIAQAAFQTREEILCLNGPDLPSHTVETDSVPEDLLNSLMDNFEAMPAPKSISQGRKLEQRSKSMLDKFLQLRGRTVPVDEPEVMVAKRQKLDSLIAMDKAPHSLVISGHPISFELPISDFDGERAGRHTYFAASRILCHGSLIRLLENNFAIDLIERVIDTVEENGEIEMGEDFIIDSKTCIFFHPHALLVQHASSNSMDAMIKEFLHTKFGLRLLKVALKYTVIHIVLTSAEEQPTTRSFIGRAKGIKTYPFTPPIQNGLGNCVLCFQALSRMLNIEIFYHFAESEHQKAWLVRSIGDRTAEMFDLEVPGNGYRSKQAWEAQEWLNVEETCAEQFLNQFSVLNCFQSQILLSQAPSLRQLFKMPLNELLERYSLWIPERSLTMWFDLLRAELVM